MAQKRAGPTSLDGGEKATLERHVGVPDPVDAAVERVQAAVTHALHDGVARQAARRQLIEGEDAPSVRGTPRDAHIGTTVDFVCVRLTNSTLARSGRSHAPTVTTIVSPNNTYA
jgi:hypothetical protein